MITIKGKNKELVLKIGFAKTKLFVAKNLKKEQSLLEVLPEAMANNDLEMLSKLCLHYQEGTNYSEAEVDQIIEESLEEENVDVMTLYKEIIEEFDTNGIIKKGMGFSMVKKLMESLDQAIEELETPSK